jgi:hypothetical protein
VDIRQEHAFMLDMVNAVRRGEMAPAAFQRPYVWEREHVEALFESILEGWPVGAFLLWRPYGAWDVSAVARGRLGPVVAESGGADAIILDGQNRLASLAWAMADANPAWPVPADMSIAEAETWTGPAKLVAAPATRRIAFVPADEAGEGERAPAGILCDSMAFNAYLRRHYGRMSDDALRWFDEAAQRLRSARVTVTALERATPEEAKRAFLRICKVGVPMSEADFDTAFAWAAPSAPGAR